jgi:UTP--glucose-1-phosphate uridylyltransferase
MIDRISKAIIPAAGLGTRMLPATKALPKEMLPVAGKPLIQHVVEEAALSGIETVILVINSEKSIIRKHFERDQALEHRLESSGRLMEADSIRRLPNLANLVYVEQQKPLGLGHAVSCARDHVAGETFAVLLPDVLFQSQLPVIQQLINASRHHPGNMVAVRKVEPEEVPSVGIVSPEGSFGGSNSSLFKVDSIVEKPALENAPSFFGIAGRYLLEPSVFAKIDQTTPDAKGEIQLTHALNLMCSKSSVYGVCVEGKHYNAGEPSGFLEANIDFAMSNPQPQPLQTPFSRR